MQDIPEEDGPTVAKAAHVVAEEARVAGVFVFSSGTDEDVDPVAVTGDGTVSAGSYPLGGFCIVDVPSREEALTWPAKIATACRCPRVVSALQGDPLA
jgi:hypothetical protein